LRLYLLRKLFVAPLKLKSRTQLLGESLTQ
jgi:hypothetical protein